MAENDFLLVREYDKRHEELTKRVERVELRLDKLETDLDTKDAELRKMLAEIRRDLAEGQLKTVELFHKLSDEVAQDRMATNSMQLLLKSEITTSLTNFQQSLDKKKSNTVWRWIGLFATLVAGSGFGALVELVIRVLTTGHP